jgi:hypothetical protein
MPERVIFCSLEGVFGRKSLEENAIAGVDEGSRVTSNLSTLLQKFLYKDLCDIYAISPYRRIAMSPNIAHFSCLNLKSFQILVNPSPM